MQLLQLPALSFFVCCHGLSRCFCVAMSIFKRANFFLGPFRSFRRVTFPGTNKNACTQGSGTYFNVRIQGLDLVLRHSHRARILGGYLIKGCVHISAQRESHKGTMLGNRNITLVFCGNSLSAIYHFTVVYSVARPMNGSKAAGDLVLIQTSLFLSCKSCCCDAN